MKYKSAVKSIFFTVILLSISCTNKNKYDVIVIGDGTGAISAAIQSSRSGAKTLLLTEFQWLGGMLTSAGVSAIDGNHELPAGIWGEFRDSIYQAYGGKSNVSTGWVSNTHFEPHVGNRIFQNMAVKEINLTINNHINIDHITYKNNWIINGTFESSQLVDGTDLGDIAAMIGVPYDKGMEKGDIVDFGNNNVIQDLTYCAILEEAENAKMINPTHSYDPSLFYCACDKLCPDPLENAHPCDVMLNYAKLPNNKYLINWPKHGNDFFTDVIEVDQKQRNIEFQKAKNKTIDFIYFIQHELGFKNLQIADDAFPSDDGLALMPYHREGRRIKGLVRLSAADIQDPKRNNLYKTGIAVGNYPIDHHHQERPDILEPEYPAIPAYSIPLGALIPQNQDHFIVADKSISVSNIANGTTRLQPVILQIGQVAGLVAAEAALNNVSPKDLDVRSIQRKVLEFGGYLSPFKDISPDHPDFKAAQRIAVCGLIDLEERPYKWANETLFHPDSMIMKEEIPADIYSYFKEKSISLDITRLEFAVLVDHHLNPFGKKIDHTGK